MVRASSLLSLVAFVLALSFNHIVEGFQLLPRRTPPTLARSRISGSLFTQQRLPEEEARSKRAILRRHVRETVEKLTGKVGGKLMPIVVQVLGKEGMIEEEGSAPPSQELKASSAGMGSAVVLAGIFRWFSRHRPVEPPGLDIARAPPSTLSAYTQYFVIMGIFVFGGRIMDFVQESVWRYDAYMKRMKSKKRQEKKNVPRWRRQRKSSDAYKMAQARLDKAMAGEDEEEEDDDVTDTSDKGSGLTPTESKAPTLHGYRCEKCLYTIYPAAGREFKFFPATFKCPSCGAGRDSFWDLNDPDDPRNQPDPVDDEEEYDEDDDDIELEDIDDSYLKEKGDEEEEGVEADDEEAEGDRGSDGMRRRDDERD